MDLERLLVHQKTVQPLCFFKIRYDCLCLDCRRRCSYCCQIPFRNYENQRKKILKQRKAEGRCSLKTCEASRWCKVIAHVLFFSALYR